MKKFKEKPFITIVLLNSIVAFLIDFFTGIEALWIYGLLIVLIEIPLIYANYKLFDNKRWAIITSLVYYSLRSFNFYFEDFTFMTKNGINIEITLFEEIGINMISFLMLIFLIVQFRKRKTFPVDASM